MDNFFYVLPHPHLDKSRPYTFLNNYDQISLCMGVSHYPDAMVLIASPPQLPWVIFRCVTKQTADWDFFSILLPFP